LQQSPTYVGLHYNKISGTLTKSSCSISQLKYNEVTYLYLLYYKEVTYF